MIIDGENGSLYFDKEEKIEFYRFNFIKFLFVFGVGDVFCVGLIYGFINKL